MGLVLLGSTLVSPQMLDDVWGMAAASAFGVEGVNRAALDGGDGVFHKPRLIEGVGVDADLNIEAIGNA